MPIQRMAFRCASGELAVDFEGMREYVFVASPVCSLEKVQCEIFIFKLSC